MLLKGLVKDLRESFPRAATAHHAADEIERLQAVIDAAYDWLNEAPLEVQVEDSGAAKAFAALLSAVEAAEAGRGEQVKPGRRLEAVDNSIQMRKDLLLFARNFAAEADRQEVEIKRLQDQLQIERQERKAVIDNALVTEIERLQAELRRMLLWHDAVREVHPIVPSPYHIGKTREVAEAAGGDDEKDPRSTSSRA